MIYISHNFSPSNLNKSCIILYAVHASIFVFCYLMFVYKWFLTSFEERITIGSEVRIMFEESQQVNVKHFLLLPKLPFAKTQIYADHFI